MGYADLHIHSTYSHDGVFSIPSILQYTSEFTDLSVIAITDHDEIDGALEAMRLAPVCGLDVVPGCEITSRDGHILALYIQERVPAGLSALETVLRVGELGGLCVAAHPMARGVHGISAANLLALLDHPQAKEILVGVEAYNAGLILQGSNYRVQRLVKDLPVAQTGGSDSHVLFTISQGVTYFPGKTADDLRLALLRRQTRAIKRETSPILKVVRQWLPLTIKRRMGWAGHAS